MGRTSKLAMAALAILLTFTTQAAGAATPPTVATAAVAKVGTVLVDGSGRTLYRYTPDKAGKPTCTGGCATAWPPLLKGATLTLGPGLKGKLAAVAIPGGKQQVTYNGIPLYRFAGDTRKGQANGQAAGKVWYVVKPGEALTPAATTTTTAKPSTPATTPTTAAPAGGGGGVPDGYYY